MNQNHITFITCRLIAPDDIVIPSEKKKKMSITTMHIDITDLELIAWFRSLDSERRAALESWLNTGDGASVVALGPAFAADCNLHKLLQISTTKSPEESSFSGGDLLTG